MAKILFYAEKEHINQYARPIIADTYIAMEWGPVPSTIRDMIHLNWFLSIELRESVSEAIEIKNNGRW